MYLRKLRTDMRIYAGILMADISPFILCIEYYTLFAMRVDRSTKLALNERDATFRLIVSIIKI